VRTRRPGHADRKFAQKHGSPVTGLALFTLGSMVCGAAISLPMLVVARAVQGPGGALIFAPGLAIIADAFPPLSDADVGAPRHVTLGLRQEPDTRTWATAYPFGRSVPSSCQKCFAAVFRPVVVPSQNW